MIEFAARPKLETRLKMKLLGILLFVLQSPSGQFVTKIIAMMLLMTFEHKSENLGVLQQLVNEVGVSLDPLLWDSIMTPLEICLELKMKVSKV